jgi:2-beta-glucuronyltransferase
MVIEVGATAFPDANFHLIGTPESHQYPSNVRAYGRMSFEQTIPYLQHADIGVAPYQKAEASEYLADSSLKLMQYGYLSIPAVCPEFAVGDKPFRSGYEPGNAASIQRAFQRAFAMIPDATRVPTLTWRDVANEFLRA